MGNFSFKNISHEPEKPSGDSLWCFRHIPTGETQLVPADSRDGAWKGIRWIKEAAWREWALIGREDLVSEMADPIEVSADFATRESVTDKWDENDAGE